MQLIENKLPASFLIAEISAIRKFQSRFRTQPQPEARSVVLLALSGAEGSAAKPACHLPSTHRADRDLASDFAGAPSFAAPTKGGRLKIEIANWHTYRKLENQLNAFPSVTSKFLIDNFLPLLNSQNESPA